MSGLMKLLLAAALGVALSGTPAAAQDIRIEPIPPHVKPHWTPVPSAPGVFYAPNIPTDVFRHGGKYYFYWQGYLYRGSKARGPWKSVTKIPAWFSEIDPSLFKTAGPAPGGPPAGPPGGSAPVAPAGPPAGASPAPPAPGPEAVPPAAPPPAPEPPGEPPAPSEPGQSPKVM